MPVRKCALILAFSMASSCAAPSGPSGPLATGLWGGDHIAMTVTSTGAHVELDCAHGEVTSPLEVDRQHEFSAAGTFVAEHGGPIRDGEVPDERPVMYSGSVSARTMSLTIRAVDTGAAIGSFTLTHGSAGRIVKCL